MDLIAVSFELQGDPQTLPSFIFFLASNYCFIENLFTSKISYKSNLSNNRQAFQMPAVCKKHLDFSTFINIGNIEKVDSFVGRSGIYNFET